MTDAEMTGADDAGAPSPGVALAERLGRIAAAVISLAIVVLSVVPPGFRPIAASQNVEHASIFFLLGTAFGLAFPGRPRLQVAAVVAFTAAVELIQYLAPGRHARLSDFVVDSLGALAGLALAAIALRLAGRIGR